MQQLWNLTVLGLGVIQLTIFLNSDLRYVDCNGQDKDNGFKLKEGTFKLDLRKKSLLRG